MKPVVSKDEPLTVCENALLPRASSFNFGGVSIKGVMSIVNQLSVLVVAILNIVLLKRVKPYISTHYI